MSRNNAGLRNLSAVRGQHGAVRLLRALATSGEPVPPLLLHGPEGVGKATAARALAAALVCRRPRGGDACGECTPCRRVGEADAVTRLREKSTAQSAPEIYPDVGAVGVPGSKTRISVLQARDVILSLQSPPFELPRRVYLIDPADRMTPSAANALLKVLEEPPDHGVLLLVTSAPWSLPITIRSRSRMVRFGRLADAEIVSILTAAGLDPDEAAMRARLAAGSPGRALRLDPEREQARLDGWAELLFALSEGADPAALAVRAGDLFGGEAAEADAALGTLLALLRDACAAELGAAPLVTDPGTAARLSGGLVRLTGPALSRVSVIDDLRSELRRFNRNPRLAVEGALLALAGIDLERSVLEDSK